MTEDPGYQVPVLVEVGTFDEDTLGGGVQFGADSYGNWEGGGW